jgi:hypothetical protein
LLPIIASNLLFSGREVIDLYFIGRCGADTVGGFAMSTTLISMILVQVPLAYILSSYAGRGDYRYLDGNHRRDCPAGNTPLRDVLERWMETGYEQKKEKITDCPY